MAFRDAVGGYTAPRLRDRQCPSRSWSD